MSKPKINLYNHVLDLCKIQCKMAVNNLKEGAVYTRNTLHDIIISIMQIVAEVAGTLSSFHHLKVETHYTLSNH